MRFGHFMLLTLATTSMPRTYKLIRVLYNEASQHKKTK